MRSAARELWQQSRCNQDLFPVVEEDLSGLLAECEGKLEDTIAYAELLGVKREVTCAFLLAWMERQLQPHGKN